MAAPSRQPPPRDTSTRSAIPRPAPRGAPSAHGFSAPTPAPLRALDTPLWKVRPQFDGFDLAETSDWIEEATPTAHDDAAARAGAADITHLSPRDVVNVLSEFDTVFTGRGERESTYGSAASSSTWSATAGPSKRPASPSAPVNVAKRRMAILETPKSDDLYARKLASSVRRATPKVFTPVTPSQVLNTPRSSESRTSRTSAQPVPPPEPLESRQVPVPPTSSKAPKVPEIARPRPGTRITIGIGSGGKVKTRAERAAANGKFVTPASRSRQTRQPPANATAEPSRVTTRPPRSAKRVAQMLPPPAPPAPPAPPPTHSADTSSSSQSSTDSQPPHQQLARVPGDDSLVNLGIPAIRSSAIADGPSRPQTPANTEPSTTPARAPPVPVEPTPVPSRATSVAIPASLPRRFFPFTFSFPSHTVATPRAANQTLQYASPALSATTAEGQAEDWDVSMSSVAANTVDTVTATPQTQVTVPSAVATPVAQMMVEPARRISASERVLRFIGGLLGAGADEAAPAVEAEEPIDVVDPETAETPVDDDVEMVQVGHVPFTIKVAPPQARPTAHPMKPARVPSGNFARPTSSTTSRAAPAKQPIHHAPSHPERPVVPLRRPLGALRTQPAAPNVPVPVATASANAEAKKPLCPPTNSRFASAALARLPKPGEGHTSKAAPTRIRDAERARDLAIKRAVFERAGKADAAPPMPRTIGGAHRLTPSASATAPLHRRHGHTPGKASRLRAEQRAVFDSGVAARAAARAAEEDELAQIRAEVEAEMDREARRTALFRANPLPEMYGRRVQ